MAPTPTPTKGHHQYIAFAAEAASAVYVLGGHTQPDSAMGFTIEVTGTDGDPLVGGGAGFAMLEISGNGTDFTPAVQTDPPGKGGWGIAASSDRVEFFRVTPDFGNGTFMEVVVSWGEETAAGPT